MKIAVIGAGISGLTAAYHLQKWGEVTVFESSDRLGGNVYTEEVAGCRVEWGANGFIDNAPATRALIAELGLEGRLLRARKDAARRYLWRDGSLRLLPTSPIAFLKSDCLPLWDRLRVMQEPFCRSAPKKEESVYKFAVRHVGRGAAETLVDAMVTGVFAGDPKRLSLRSAFPQVHRFEAKHGSLVRGMRAAKGEGPRGGPLTSFDEGLDVLVKALAERLDVRLGYRLQNLPEGFDHVVCTAHASRAADLVEGRLERLLRRIPTAPIAVVALVFRQSAFRQSMEVPDAFGFLVPRGQKLRILGTLYDSSIFPQRAPEGFRLFRVLIGGRRDPQAVELSDDQLLRVVAGDLKRVWGKFPDPHHVHIIRHSLGISQYEMGHEQLLQEIEAECPPHLRLAGSSYRGVAFNACIREARSWDPGSVRE